MLRRRPKFGWREGKLTRWGYRLSNYGENKLSCKKRPFENRCRSKRSPLLSPKHRGRKDNTMMKTRFWTPDHSIGEPDQKSWYRLTLRMKMSHMFGYEYIEWGRQEKGKPRACSGWRDRAVQAFALKTVSKDEQVCYFIPNMHIILLQCAILKLFGCSKFSKCTSNYKFSLKP